MSPDSLLEDYLANKAPNTARSARTTWAQWREFIRPTPPESAMPAHSASFLASLKRRGLSDNTIKQRFEMLHSFYSYLADMRAVEFNVFRPARRTISWRRREQVRPTALIPLSSVRAILKAPDARSTDGIRDGAMLALWFGCGLRRSELRALTVGDILVGIHRDHRGKRIHALKLARTKAGKTQEQPLPDWAWLALSALIT